jgi:uncharacterized protein
MLPTTPDNNPAELRAFDDVCGRLAGFDPVITFEWVDGFMTALNAGPQVPAVEDWLPALCGDAFDRAFADPPSHAQALRALKARMAVLRDQLNPELLMERPDELRLHPLMAEWTDADRERLVAEEAMTADDAAAVQTGALWADGFLAGVEQFASLWPEPADDDEMAPLYQTLWDQLVALGLTPGSPEMQAHLAEYFPDRQTTRDDLVVEASYAVQDLRVWWVDHAPRPQTRYVDKSPGRNDPCPCGSGRKFKKCHGAA